MVLKSSLEKNELICNIGNPKTNYRLITTLGTKTTSTYEKLISTYFIKNTKRLGLSGNVKKIKETQTKKSAVEGNAFVNDTCYYGRCRLEKSLLQLL
jgi:hypothetical protein